MSEKVTPLEWTPELFRTGSHQDLWCVVRWAARDDGDIFLCGPLELQHGDLPADRYQGPSALGFSLHHDSGGFLALFPDAQTAERFIEQDPHGRRGQGIERNHALPLSALRFEVVTHNFRGGPEGDYVWCEDEPYFEAMKLFAQAVLFERGNRYKNSSIDLAKSIRRAWTAADLRAELRGLGNVEGLLAEFA